MKPLFFIAVLLLAGCTTTKLTSSWTAPEAGSRNYKKIMVVGMIQSTDSTMQRTMEKHLTDDLKSMGYNAVCYTDLFKTGELKNLRYDSVRKKLTDKEIDGVITIGLMASEKVSVYVRDRQSIYVESTPLGAFWDPPKTVKQETGKPGYYVSSTSYYWESYFYDVGSIALLYSARSTAFEVSSTGSMAHKYGKLIVEDMQKNYLLTARK